MSVGTEEEKGGSFEGRIAYETALSAVMLSGEKKTDVLVIQEMGELYHRVAQLDSRVEQLSADLKLAHEQLSERGQLACNTMNTTSNSTSRIGWEEEKTGLLVQLQKAIKRAFIAEKRALMLSRLRQPTFVVAAPSPTSATSATYAAALQMAPVTGKQT